MSWGTISASAVAAELGTALAAAASEYIAAMETNGYPLSDEALQQVHETVKAAGVLAATGACGPYVRAMLSGHANPEHKPLPGWANDALGINLWSAEPEPAPTTVAELATASA